MYQPGRREREKERKREREKERKRERERVSKRVSRDERLEIRHHVEITASKISTSVTVTVIV